MQWITAGQLENWARLATARADLPKLVGDLIRASCPDITSFRFPSGEKGQVRGFDGNLETSQAALNVPEGRSYWEFGTNEKYKTKATSEFKRVSEIISEDDQKDASFVFVTPWTWDSSDPRDKLEDWEARSRTQYNWKQVCLLDGSKLETWLESCPAVSAWHAKNILRLVPQDGARSTDEFWEFFINHFDPPLTEEVLLCEREQQSEKLLNALVGNPDRISFSADLPDEVIAFAIAAIRKAKPEVRLFLEARTLVVDNMKAGRMLLARPNLTYLLRGDAADAPGQFANRGPTLTPLGRFQRTGVTQALNRPSGQALGIALRSMGLPEVRATTLARGCGRSLTVLMRQIPGGRCQPPGWMPQRDILLPAILLGGWDANNELDVKIVEGIAEVAGYHKYERELRGLLNSEDPPLEKEGSVWKVRAPIDAFLYIGELIGQDHLHLLRIAMAAVFSRIEPEPDPKAIVRLSDPPTRHSDWLREGLATSLLLIAVWQKEAKLTLTSTEGQRFANELIESLPGLKTNYRLLASLRDELPLLAEAAPDPLLMALEQMLEGDGAAIRPLFVETEGLLFPVAHHTGLLWALETLAWDPSYFDRAVKVLARLAAIDPGGRISNRPINSLREIFVLWNPNTNAMFSQRLSLIDWICSNLPAIGWQLIRMLLPAAHDTSTPTARPRLREAGASDRPAVTYEELWDNQSAIIMRAIRLAGASSPRWIELLPCISNFSPQNRVAAFSALEAALDGMKENDRRPLWEKVRDEVRKHERFSAAAWALPSDQLRPLRDLMEQYATFDPIADAVWLFDVWIQDAHKDQEGASRERVEALRGLLAGHGLDSVLKLGLKTKLPHKVVEAINALPLSQGQIEVLLVNAVEADPASNFSMSLSRLHYEIAGGKESTSWLLGAMRSQEWSAKTTARLLMTWPLTTSTWHFARRLGRDVVEAYWRNIGAVWIAGSKHDLIRAELSFLKYHQGLAALGTAGHRLRDVPTRILLAILDAVLNEITTEAVSAHSISTWDLENLFKELDNRSDAADGEVAKREFSFLPALEQGDRPLRLHKAMSADPDFYHFLLCQVFLAKNEPESRAEPTEEERARARLTYSLISKFVKLPGLTDANLDGAVLTHWIDRVRELAAASDRAEIADIYIGHLLAHSPLDVDGGWPNRLVRDQIERLRSTDIEHGIQIERFNMRGAHWKSPYGGGGEERGFADQNRRYASTAVAWPRTAAMLRAIAASWDVHAEREDVEARQRKLKS